MAIFDPAFKRTLDFEGIALADVPGDSGGLTFCGISRHSFPGWQGWAIIDHYVETSTDLGVAKHLSVNDSSLMALVEMFYKTSIWNQNKLGDLQNQELANQLYDAVVNCGQRAVKAIQGLLSVGVDGIMGSKTTDACNFYPAPDDLVDRFLSWRKNYYQMIVQAHPEQDKFLNGWLKRCQRSTTT